MPPPASKHRVFEEALRLSVLAEPGNTPATLRQAAAACAANGARMDPPFDALVRQIGEAAHRVTDAQVAAAVEKVGEPAAFELIVAAATGAGLHRWTRGLAVLEAAMKETSAKEAFDAPT